MKILYFAWVRERIGRAGETLEVPGEVKTVAGLIDWLKGRGEEYAHAFEDTRVIRAALDQEHAPLDASLDGIHEVAFFPPVTGG